MEYTIQQVAKMANVSSRTLRYYDEIGLLKPRAIRSSGHRIYGQTELTILQNILFYRSLHLPLKEIKAIVTNPNFDFEEALVSHHQQLVAQISRRFQTDSCADLRHLCPARVPRCYFLYATVNACGSLPGG